MTDETVDPLEVARRLRPLGAKLVCLPIEAAAVTAGGIIMPGQEDAEVPSMARVVSVGPKVTPNTWIDAVIVYQKYQGTRYELDGVTVLVLLEEFVDGIVTLPDVDSARPAAEIPA